MNSVYFSKKNSGIGLIEVLITTVVVAIGLLGVASMQGGFMSGSAGNKTRAEAIALAERKIEQLRNNIVVANYTAIANSTAPESIGGVNASFSRSWVVTQLTPPTRKKIAVTVTWGGASADERVMLTSEIAFYDPGLSAGIAASGAGANGKSPSPNQESSKTVNDKTVELFDTDGDGNPTTLKDGFTPVSGTTTLFTDADGNLYRLNGGGVTGSQVFNCNTLNQFDVDWKSPQNYDATTGVPLYDQKTDTFLAEISADDLIYLYTRRLNLDGVTGNEVIELFTQNFTTSTSGNTVTYTPDGTCTREHQFFGGAIVSIKGTVHTANNLDDIKIDFNKEDMFCVYNPGTGQAERPYACYAGGNCNVSSAGDNSIVNTCPDPAAADAKVGPGGFSGNVGLLNIDDDGAGKESVCFKEELDGGPIATHQVAIIQPATARKYKTNNNGLEQGVNRSYDCQDFYIVDRQANFSKLAAKCAGVAGALNLAPKEIVRTINGANVLGNTTDNLTNTTYCAERAETEYTLTINLPSDVPGETYTVKTPGVTCTPTPASTTATCTVTTSGNTIEVFAISNTGNTGSCIFGELDPSATSRSCTLTVQAPPTYTIIGPLEQPNGSPSFEVRAFDSFRSFNCDYTSSSYTCSISTNDSVVTIKTINTRNENIIDYCAQTITVGTSTYNPSCSLTTKK